MSIKNEGPAGWAVHPGEILREEFLEPMNISAYRLAIELHVSPPTVNDIVREKRGITPEMATRLAKYFGTSEQFWLTLQEPLLFIRSSGSIPRTSRPSSLLPQLQPDSITAGVRGYHLSDSGSQTIHLRNCGFGKAGLARHARPMSPVVKYIRGEKTPPSVISRNRTLENTSSFPPELR
jgi:addiction module HigA family antidote